MLQLPRGRKSPRTLVRKEGSSVYQSLKARAGHIRFVSDNVGLGLTLEFIWCAAGLDEAVFGRDGP
jgi:hypothetical protein